jgi:glycosyltransferase involved in cell wall biosynthesis
MTSLGISVVIPTYNRAHTVGRAIDSALAAVRPGDEVLVVDDGSTDDTAARVGTYGDRVRFVPSPHRGPGATRNRGVAEARLPLVAFLDSDDEWFPDKLELQRAVMEARPDVLFSFSDFAHRSGNGAVSRRYLRRWHGDARSWTQILGPGVPFSSLRPLPADREDFLVHTGDLYLTEMRGDYVCTCTVVVRREAAGERLRFAEDLLHYEDWECFGRLAGAGPAAYLDCETLWVWGHDEARLTRTTDRLRSETARLVALERVWGSDASFLARHGDDFREVLRSHRRARAKELLAHGRTREARSEFARAGAPTLAERVLLSLPGPLTEAIVALRRRLAEAMEPSAGARADSAGRA